MSRSERLFELLQVLRRHRRPVSAKVLAEKTGVSVRTLYRDIDSLRAQGAPIEGEAGVGYVLKPGFVLPPLMFSVEEVEALVLGARWLAARADAPLAAAAADALARIAAVLPAELREELEASALLVGPGERPDPERIDPALLRCAIRLERKLLLDYRDGSGISSHRTVWPFALGFFDRARVLVAWCELRGDFRHFRTDRLDHAEMLEARYPGRRQALLRQWRKAQGIAPPIDGS
ncbi:helix-turn-helix transcriptional regulator [Kushneria aurantia]|uniref:Helix-turn-helix transcriptional regulator n=1 Tax=Kushneria aurantia TaxID=504092 RepID=A0ABV6G377_9GAMM|nr:YafY family protein [Kushneria aurantia]